MTIEKKGEFTVTTNGLVSVLAADGCVYTAPDDSLLWNGNEITTGFYLDKYIHHSRPVAHCREFKGIRCFSIGPGSLVVNGLNEALEAPRNSLIWPHNEVDALERAMEIEPVSETAPETTREDKITNTTLPTVAADRKQCPIFSGVLMYFPDAIAEVAHTSYMGNEQHNPGEPLHWSRGKSDDHEDCLTRHIIERGTIDTDGIRHSAKAAWRALAILQLEIEKAREQ